MATALSTAWRYRQVILLAAKVLKFVADRINESTPQERENISHHMQAIYQILRGAAKRKGEEIDLQPLSIFALPPESGGVEESTTRITRRERVREATGQFLNSLKQYRLNLTRAELAEIGDHLKDIRRLVAEIDRRVKS